VTRTSTTVVEVPAGPRTRRIGVPAVLGSGIAIALLAAVGLFVSMQLAGLLFAIWLFGLAAMRPDLAFALMFGTAPFVWDIGGGPVKMAASEIAMVVAFPAFLLLGRARPRFHPLWWPILAYLLVCAASILLNGEVGPSISTIVQMIVYMVIAVFMFSSCIRDPRELDAAMYAMLGANLILVLALLISRSNYVWGLHKNSIGTHLAFAVVVATEMCVRAAASARSERRRLRTLMVVLALLAVGLVFTLSRGAWVGTASGILVMFALRGRLLGSLRFAMLLAPLVMVCWLLLPAESREYASDLSASAHNVHARLVSIEFALAEFKTSPIYGVGVGLRKTYDATNLVMSTLAETGVLGLASFVSIFITLAGMAVYSARRLDADDLAFSLMVLGAGLVTCKLVHGMVDHYWGRGILPAWAGAGMVAFAYVRARALARRKAA
jgi:hypothetical protein